MTAYPDLVRDSSGEPTIDHEILTELRGMGDDFLAELVELFVHDAAPLVAQLRDAVELHDTAAVQRLSHSIKGMCAQLGGRRLAALCDALGAEEKDDSNSAQAVLREVELGFVELRRALAVEILRTGEPGA